MVGMAGDGIRGAAGEATVGGTVIMAEAGVGIAVGVGIAAGTTGEGGSETQARGAQIKSVALPAAAEAFIEQPGLFHGLAVLVRRSFFNVWAKTRDLRRIVKAADRRSKQARMPSLPEVRNLDRLIPPPQSPPSARVACPYRKFDPTGV